MHWNCARRDASYGVLMLVLLLATALHAQAMNGALRMSENAALSTSLDPAFHTVGQEGLTVEGWFLLDSLPGVGQVQTLFTHRRKYTVGVGTAEFSRDDEWYDPAEARAFGSVWWQDGGMSFTSVMGLGDDRVPPVGEWFHVAMQFHGEPPFPGSILLHRHTLNMDAGGDGADIPIVLDEGDGPLYIATAQSNIGDQRGFQVVARTDIAGLRGLVDEFRVSNVIRYASPDAVRPRHFAPDSDTLALWTFDGVQTLEDTSGNGRHLIQDGAISIESLAAPVAPGGKLATTWAGLRSHAQ